MKIKYVLYGLILAACFQLLMSSSCVDSLTNPKKENPDQKVEESAKKAENAFLSGDTTQLKNVMTTTAISYYKNDFSGIAQVMKKMGEAMKSRKIISHTTNLVEIQVTYENHDFIMIFALQDDDSWKLVRF